MGLFNDDLNKTAITMAKIIKLLEDLDSKIHSYHDIEDYKDEFFFVAYVIRIGILDRIAKNRWPLTCLITIPTGLFSVNKTDILNGLNLTVDKLKKIVADDPLIDDFIEGILNRGEYFMEYDRLIPISEKKKI